MAKNINNAARKKAPMTRSQRRALFITADRCWVRAIACVLYDTVGQQALVTVFEDAGAEQTLARLSDEAADDLSSWTRALSDHVHTLADVPYGIARLKRALKVATALRPTIDFVRAVDARGLDGMAEAPRAAFERYRHTGDELLERVILDSRRLVQGVVAQRARNHDHRQDLMQAGLCGLVRAAHRFDVQRGYTFATCAMFWVRAHLDREQPIIDSQLSAGWRDWAQKRRLHAIASKHECFYPSERDSSWLARAAEIDEDMVGALFRLSRCAEYVPDDDHGFAHSSVGMDATETAACLDDMRERIASALGVLDPRSRHVVARRFGVNGHTVASVSQIADEIGVSGERTRQIYKAALAKLGTCAGIQALAADGDLAESA